MFHKKNQILASSWVSSCLFYEETGLIWAPKYSQTKLYSASPDVGGPDLLRAWSLYLCQFFEFHRYHLSYGGVQLIRLHFDGKFRSFS